MKNIIRTFAAVSALGVASIAQALTSYSVSLDTSSLIGDPLGVAPYYLDFQLNDGGLPGNNSATISGFDFGGGSATSDIGTFGDASGDLWSMVQLSDADFWNEFYQSFIPGDWVSFVVTLSNNPNNPGDFPDLFSFAILDTALGFPAQILTESLSGSLLEINIEGSLLVVDAFSGVDEYQGVSAPKANQVPDGSAYGIGFASIFCMIALSRRLERRRSL